MTDEPLLARLMAFLDASPFSDGFPYLETPIPGARSAEEAADAPADPQ